MGTENLAANTPENGDGMKAVLEQELLNAPEGYRDFFVDLVVAKEYGFPGHMARFTNFSALSFVTAMKMAERINALNQDNSQPDHWVSPTVLRGLSQTPQEGVSAKELRLAVGVSVPYAEHQTDESIRGTIELLPEMAKFRYPLK